MNRFFQTISQYIFFQHHTYVSELYFFKGDSSLQCTTVALRRKISANICLLSFLAWSMVARKQKWNLKKKTHKNNKRKWNWLGSDIQLRILLLLLGFQTKCVFGKKNSNKKAKSTNKQQHWARNCPKSWNVIGVSHTKYT